MLFYVPHKRTPAAARSWLLLIFMFPFLGLILYSIFGRAYLPERRLKAQKFASGLIRTRGQELLGEHNVHPSVAENFTPAVRLAETLGDFGAVGGNQLELLTDYGNSIARLIADIDNARDHVHLLYYIFANDETGRAVVEALLRATQRGVACRVLMDGYGSKDALRHMADQLRRQGIEVHETLPVRFFRRKSARFDLRNHRKIAVLDGKIAYIGSQNIVNRDFKKGIVYEELVARVTGPVVLQLQAVFLTDYFIESETSALPQDCFPLAETTGVIAAQALPSGPGYPHANLQNLIVSLLHAARTRVVITTPYFIPDEAILYAMKIAVMRGVAVHLILSRTADQILVCQAQRSYYDELLEAGVQLYLYRERLLHAKFLTFDDQVAMIGSTNLDMRSFLLNEEVVLLVYNPQAIHELQSIQERYMGASDTLTLDAWRQRSRLRQVIENTARLVDSVL
ncbi:MAG: cardiolipin synthase [Planctomycetes bacterium]|nr:cardiolipin synthase [Planctomycetota bacterium]